MKFILISHSAVSGGIPWASGAALGPGAVASAEARPQPSRQSQRQGGDGPARAARRPAGGLCRWPLQEHGGGRCLAVRTR